MHILMPPTVGIDTMSNLRTRLIRLAHEHPEFRKDILPLVQASDRKANPTLSQKLSGPVDRISSNIGGVAELAAEYEVDPSEERLAELDDLIDDISESVNNLKKTMMYLRMERRRSGLQ